MSFDSLSSCLWFADPPLPLGSLSRQSSLSTRPPSNSLLPRGLLTVCLPLSLTLSVLDIGTPASNPGLAAFAQVLLLPEHVLTSACLLTPLDF